MSAKNQTLSDEPFAAHGDSLHPVVGRLERIKRQMTKDDWRLIYEIIELVRWRAEQRAKGIKVPGATYDVRRASRQARNKLKAARKGTR